MKERKKLVEELAIHLSENICKYDWICLQNKDEYFKVDKRLFKDIARFIISNKTNMVEPLVKHKKLWCGNWKEYTASQSIDQTLQLAGIDGNK